MLDFIFSGQIAIGDFSNCQHLHFSFWFLHRRFNFYARQSGEDIYTLWVIMKRVPDIAELILTG